MTALTSKTPFFHQLMFDRLKQMSKCGKIRRTEHTNGREGETATLFGRCLFNFNLSVAGFAPCHLNR